MTAFTTDVRELSSDEIGEVSGASAWGQVQGWGMVIGGATVAFAAAVTAVPSAGVTGFVAAGGIATMIAGMHKIEEEK